MKMQMPTTIAAKTNKDIRFNSNSSSQNNNGDGSANHSNFSSNNNGISKEMTTSLKTMASAK